MNCEKEICVYCVKKNNIHHDHDYTEIRDKMEYDNLLLDARIKTDKIKRIINKTKTQENSALQINNDIIECLIKDKQ